MTISGGATRSPLESHRSHETLLSGLTVDRALPEFEHGFFLLDGDCAFEGQDIEARTLYYLPPGRSEGEFRSREGSRVLLVGGPPFPEKILMWWNFVARTTAEIKSARADWAERRRFGSIRRHSGERIEAPEMMRLAAP